MVNPLELQKCSSPNIRWIISVMIWNMRLKKVMEDCTNEKMCFAVDLERT